jgi:hypothetical protein
MIVQGLWVGNVLSTMERLSISSFLANGHEYHLYVYRDVPGVPEGTTVLDAAGIVAEGRIGNFSWLAEFSDLFRYKLLLERGGIWADLDVICLRPFQIHADYLFPRTDHIGMLGRDEPESGIAIDGWFLKAPAGSQLMRICLERAIAGEGKQNAWGHIGPENLCTAATELGLLRHASHWKFFPINWKRYRDFTEATPLSETLYSRLGHTALVMHLYREMWIKNGVDPDSTFDKASIYEKLKARYLLDHRR